MGKLPDDPAYLAQWADALREEIAANERLITEAESRAKSLRIQSGQAKSMLYAINTKLTKMRGF